MKRDKGSAWRGVLLFIGVLTLAATVGCETMQSEPEYWSDRPRARPIRPREEPPPGDESPPPPYARAAQESGPRAGGGRTRAAGMVQKADTDAQEALAQARFEVERAFQIAEQFSRGLSAMEVRAARRDALAGLRTAQDKTLRAMETAVREADRFERAQRPPEDEDDSSDAEVSEAQARAAQRRERSRARELDRQWRQQREGQPAEAAPPQEQPSAEQAPPPGDWTPSPAPSPSEQPPANQPPADQPPADTPPSEQPLPPTEPGPPPPNWGGDGR